MAPQEVGVEAEPGCRVYALGSRLAILLGVGLVLMAPVQQASLTALVSGLRMRRLWPFRWRGISLAPLLTLGHCTLLSCFP